MAQQRVAVIGAGLAGLAAAMDLADAGIDVEIFERSRLLGGRATSFEVNGREVDNGQHVFLACCDEFIDFVDRAGMADALHLQDRFEAVVLERDGTAGRLRAANLPAPLHVVASFLRYPHLTAAAKLQIATALGSAMLTRDAGSGTFESWLQRTGQGEDARRGFWDPFFIPALNAPFDRVNNTDAMFVLKTAFLSDASAARFGFSNVPLAHIAAAAARRASAVHLSTAVSRVRPGDGVDLQLLDGSTRPFDAAVLAVTPRALTNLLEDPQRFGIGGIDKFDAFPIVDIHLWHDGPSMGYDFAAALDSPLQWIFEKSPGYLCCSCSAAEEYFRLPTQQLEALAWEEVRAFLRFPAEVRLLDSAVTRNPEATYLPRPGEPRPGQRTNVPQLAIAGAWTHEGWPDTMESAVRSGRSAASAIVEELASAPSRAAVGSR
ncbi:MAG TPA: hydroxysqualene dehydroxylase HpnE [Candidatus Tumulicola sp.]